MSQHGLEAEDPASQGKTYKKAYQFPATKSKTIPTLVGRGDTGRIPIRGRMLGIKTTKVALLIEQLLKGLPYKAIHELERESGLSLETIAETVAIPARTLARRKSQNRFEADESERLLRLAVVFEKALDLFEGDAAAARQWLQTPADALSGTTPLQMTKSEIGAREVENLIGRLEHGVYS